MWKLPLRSYQRARFSSPNKLHLSFRRVELTAKHIKTVYLPSRFSTEIVWPFRNAEGLAARRGRSIDKSQLMAESTPYPETQKTTDQQRTTVTQDVIFDPLTTARPAIRRQQIKERSEVYQHGDRRHHRSSRLSHNNDRVCKVANCLQIAERTNSEECTKFIQAQTCAHDVDTTGRKTWGVGSSR